MFVESNCDQILQNIDEPPARNLLELISKTNVDDFDLLIDYCVQNFQGPNLVRLKKMNFLIFSQTVQ